MYDTTYRQRVRQAYKIERTKNLPAKQAQITAKYEAQYGFGSPKRRVMPHPGGSEVIDLPNGWSVGIKIEYDNDYEAPWEWADGHGVVMGRQSRDETLEGWELSSDRSIYRYYDWRVTLPIAIRDGWDAPPYKTGNKHERAMRAMKADYEYLRRWCNDQWHYVGLIVTLKDEHGKTIDEDSCWGIESDSEDYLCSEARSWAASMIRKVRKGPREDRRQERIANRFHDAMECGL